jgi:hypothetical protein
LRASVSEGIRAALRQRAPLRLELGDSEGFRSDLEELRAIPRTALVPLFRSLLLMWDGMHALFEGRFDDAEAFADKMLQSGGADPNFRSTYGAQLFTLHRERGRLTDVREFVQGNAERASAVMIARAMYALTLVESGELADGRNVLDVLTPEQCAPLAVDGMRTTSLAYLVEVAARSEERAAAETVYGPLLAHAGHLIVLGWGVACLGAVDRFLGMIASTLGRWEAAEEHYETAMGLEQKVGSPPLLARTCYTELVGAALEAGVQDPVHLMIEPFPLLTSVRLRCPHEVELRDDPFRLRATMLEKLTVACGRRHNADGAVDHVTVALPRATDGSQLYWQSREEMSWGGGDPVEFLAPSYWSNYAGTDGFWPNNFCLT